MLSVRPATIDDVGLLRTLIRELAEFEHELDHCIIEEDDLARDGFGPNPKFRALIAEWDGKAASYAVFFSYYSTWAGAVPRGRVCAFTVSRERNRDSPIGRCSANRLAGE
jgi:hypothetical protein